jgi:IstB-like ATP binding protein
VEADTIAECNALARWMRYEMIALDQQGYVRLAEIDSEFLYQVIAERAERTVVIVTTNLPFSAWTLVLPNPRLCKASLDRITDGRRKSFETGRTGHGRASAWRRRPLRPVPSAENRTRDTATAGATETTNPATSEENNGLRVSRIKLSNAGICIFSVLLCVRLGRLRSIQW